MPAPTTTHPPPRRPSGSNSWKFGPVVVVVLPFLELVGEEAGVVDDLALEEAVELLGVDAVGSLDLAVEAGCSGPDPDVADALVEQVPVERRAELLAVVGLDLVDRERQLDRTWSMNWIAVVWSLRG